MLQRITGETYERRRARYEEAAIVTTPVDGLGRAGFLAGDAQIEVWVGDEAAISLGLMLITFFGDVPVTPEKSRTGLIALAEKVAKRL